MAGNATTWAVNLSRYGARWRQVAVTLLNGLTFRAYAAVVSSPDHPVRTGRARAGWAIGVEAPGDFLPAKGQASYDIPTSDRFVSIIAGAALEAKRIIYNNVEYVVFLEDGTPRMAGRHFVQMAIQKLKAGGTPVEVAA